MTLDALPLGQEAVITAVGGSGALRCHLLDMGLIPKTTVRVEKIAPLGIPLNCGCEGILCRCARRTPETLK
jgi:ferrous iron transport protein A